MGNCVEDFEMFVVQSQTGLDAQVGGIMGLSRNNNLFLSDLSYKVGPLFLDELYK